MKNTYKLKKSYEIDRVCELTATKQRSFYGKAKVLIAKGGHGYMLRSYETIHCMVDESGAVHRFSDYKSNTTCRHLREFLRDGYKGYWKLPLEAKPSVSITL